jgi:Gpi18-like mannosyltransferase
MKKHSFKNYLLIAIFIIFSLFNFNLFEKGAHSDMGLHLMWGSTAQNGVSKLYKNNITDYPPLYLYVIKSNYKLSSVLARKTSKNFFSVFITISKIIPTLFNFLIGFFIYKYYLKQNLIKAFSAALLYWFNFGLIYNSGYWGQVDAVFTFFLFISLYLLIDKKYIKSSAFFALSFVTKIQSIIFIPIIGLVGIKQKRNTFIKMLLMGVVIILLVIIPYINKVELTNLIKNVGFIGSYSTISVNAYNIWHLFVPSATNWFTSPNDLIKIFGISLRSIGLFLITTYTLLVLYQLNKSLNKTNIILASSSLALAFFMLPTQIHERYLFPFFATFSLILFKNKRYLLIYIILSITYLLNLMIVFPFQNSSNLLFLSIQNLINFFSRNYSLKILSNLISITNTIVFIYLSKIGIFSGLLKNLKKDYLHTRRLLFYR